MRDSIRMMAIVAGIPVLACAMGVGPFGTAGAQEEPRAVKTARGGYLAVVGRYRFEVFSYRTGMRIFPKAIGGAPLDASNLTGTATFYHPNSPQPWFTRPLHPFTFRPGQTSESLDLVMDLGTVPPAGAKVGIEIGGLTGAAESKASFSVPFELVEPAANRTTMRPAPAEVHGYAPIADRARYFPLAGYYRTEFGDVWVPSPGYYHLVSSTQYYPPNVYRPAAGWTLAHPAPSPGETVVQTMPPNLSGIQTDYFWHPRAMDDPLSHETWIKEQIKEQSARNSRR